MQKQYDGFFRGVQFLVSGDFTEKNEGQFVKWEFPYQKIGKTLPHGVKSRQYPVDCFVGGDNVNQDDINLQKALRDQTAALLVHPFFGQHQVRCLSFTRDASTKYKGIIKYKIEFEETSFINYPVESDNKKLKTETEIDTLKSDISSYISNNFSTLFSGSSTNTITTLTSLSSYANKAMSYVKGTSSTINDVRFEIDSFIGLIPDLASGSSSLSDSIMLLFDSISSVSTGVLNRLDFWSSFFDFDDDVEIKAEITEERKEIANNERTIRGAVQSTALMKAYEDFLTYEFSDIEELDTVKETLEDQFNKVINAEEVDDSVVGSLKNVRSSFREYIDNESLSVSNIIEVDVPKMPLIKIVYDYYGNLDNYDKILLLNKIQNPSFVSGTIKMLTDDTTSS